MVPKCRCSIATKCLRALSGLFSPNLIHQSSCRILTTYAKTRSILYDDWSIMSSTGVWNREDLGPSDLYFIVCSSFIHSCYNSSTMIYLITIYEVRFCIYLSYVCTYFTTLCLLFTIWCRDQDWSCVSNLVGITKYKSLGPRSSRFQTPVLDKLRSGKIDLIRALKHLAAML